MIWDGAIIGSVGGTKMMLVTVSIRKMSGRELRVISAEDENHFAEKMGKVPFAWRRINTAACRSSLKSDPPPIYEIQVELELDLNEEVTQ